MTTPAASSVELAACEGAATVENHDSCEHMEECQQCGARVRWDLVDHPLFGFKAGCIFRRASR